MSENKKTPRPKVGSRGLGLLSLRTRLETPPDPATPRAKAKPKTEISGWKRYHYGIVASGVKKCKCGTMNGHSIPDFNDLVGEVVVIDLASPYIYVGRLAQRQGEFLVLRDADCHDLRDAQATREKYILDCRMCGVTPNRAWAWIALRDVVGLSRLADVLEC